MKNPEILRYRNNKLAYSLCLLAIAIQCIGFIFSYSSLKFNAQFNTGLDIIINIIFLLVTFLLAEKIKIYNVTCGIVAIVLGIVNTVRIYTYYYNPNSGELIYETVETWIFYLSIISYVLVAVLMTISGILTIIKGNELKAFLSSLKEGK